MRLVALALTAAALAVPAGVAAANTTCADVTSQTAVCVEFTCNDHHCINRTYEAVYTTCDRPMPPATCVRVILPSST